MAMNHTEVEQMMRDLGCDGDKITSALIESRIVDVDYETVVIAGQKLMYCGIRMDNGFVVVGKPATCIDPANWRDEIGRKISYDNAFSEIWKLEAYRKLSFNAERIARLAHEVNRAYCQSLGDNSQVPWEEAPDWQKESAIKGVAFHQKNPDATPEDSHESWLEEKLNDGWVHGDVKDAVARCHPCVTAYENLPQEQRSKDYLFKAVVTALS